MPQFDFFSQPQGPEIDMNLYPQAALAGINAGNAQKTIAQNVMGGVEQGLNLYSKFQQTQENAVDLQLKQHQVEQLPVQDRIQAAQAQNAEAIAKINDLKAEVDVNTQTQVIDATKSKLEAEKAKSDEEALLIKNKNEFETQFKSVDPNTQKQMIFSGQFNDVFAKYPDVYKRALGSTVQYMSTEERDNAASSLDFLRKLEIDNKKAALNKAFNDKLLENFNKTAETVASGSMRDLLKGRSLPDFLEHTQMYPAGVKQYDEKTMQLREGVSDGKPAGAGAGYDVFVDGKLSPYSSLIKDADYTNFNVLQDSYTRMFGKIGPTGAPTASPGTQNTPTPPQKSRDEKLSGALKASGFDPETVMKDMTPGLDAVKEQAKSASIWERAIATVEPSYLNKASNSLFPSVDSPEDTLNLKKKVEASAESMAAQSYKQFTDGTPEQRSVVRDWASQNGVTPTYKGFNDYYKTKLTSALDTAYQGSWNMGLDEKATERRKVNAAAKIKAEAKNVYKGKTLAEALGVKKNVEEAIQAEPTASPTPLPKTEITPQDVTAKTGISGREAAKHAANANRVSFSPLFEDRPFYVKAIGAVESSGGRNNLSKTGVVGPMQVIKTVAAHYRKNRNIPEENMDAGQMLLEDLFNAYDGNRELAYAAYNSGEPAVNYARKLANSNNWKEVKHFMLPALKHYEDEIRVPAHDKLKEVYNYPEMVSVYEKLFV